MDLPLDLSLALALAWRWISSRMDFVRATASLFFFALPASSLMAFFLVALDSLLAVAEGAAALLPAAALSPVLVLAGLLVVTLADFVDLGFAAAFFCKLFDAVLVFDLLLVGALAELTFLFSVSAAFSGLVAFLVTVLAFAF
ncbi:MAG: hypothetical protein O2964_01895 [Verrucomicrobia bacterium]|nr:hypothetical protein [Verrucomicrobiota bacterium]